jgi:TRAP-type mannitol/chloroaromatic compound transport system permease small subunit
MWHAEPPMSVFSLPLLAYAGWKEKIKIKTILLGAIVFLVPFLPLLVFDWRHDWLQLRSLLDFLSGNTRGLQEIRPLSLWERLLDRPQKFWVAFTQSVGLIMAVATMVMVVLKRQKFNQFVTQWLKLSWVYLGTLALIFVVYPHDLKLFYFEGLRLLLIIIAAASFKKLPLWLPVILVLINLGSIRPNRTFKSLYINQIEAIDRIYEDAAGEGFKVYTFVPAIYDYNWQYLWLWRGLNKYGYLPADFSYWPDVPEYVPYKDAALTRLSDKIKPAENLVYFIVTTGSVQEREAWFSRFDEVNWVFISQDQLPDDTMISKFETR